MTKLEPINMTSVLSELKLAFNYSFMSHIKPKAKVSHNSENRTEYLTKWKHGNNKRE